MLAALLAYALLHCSLAIAQLSYTQTHTHTGTNEICLLSALFTWTNVN